MKRLNRLADLVAYYLLTRAFGAKVFSTASPFCIVCSDGSLKVQGIHELVVKGKAGSPPRHK